jgi:hypothetical protein
MAVVFGALSLGPTLQIGAGQYLKGMLPFRWLFENVPYLNLSRTPARFIFLANVCLTVLAAQWLVLRLGQRRSAASGKIRRYAFGTGIALLVIGYTFVERVDGSIELWEVTSTPRVYYEIRNDDSIDAVFEAPIIGASQICNRYMYWQMTHDRKVANGYLTHCSAGANQLMDQITDPKHLDGAQSDLLRDAGIDAIVRHDSYTRDRLVRLIRLGRESP